ncbi:hypothetical protein [Cyanobium gracile]|uniref:Uncharacterized protein n=1 Tax=Cyanobium gracile (strain ATCC 27147 / PCC 6307) TaxID=292564 RepID=K9P4N9_CYAGP|nr:hypothetical protein [Cyanobium gracile]AFY27691.1 hypothetical protein Cyagr_0499 [Cyanobium gracile PCC 6307]
MGSPCTGRVQPLLGALLGSVLAGLLPCSGRASDAAERPRAPQAPVQYFQSDPLACQPDAIRAAYKAHLQPFADQSPAVLAKLRRVQDDMTLASLKRCVQKGLLTRPQASVLFRELGLTLPGTVIPVTSAPAPGAAQPASAPATAP